MWACPVPFSHLVPATRAAAVQRPALAASRAYNNWRARQHHQHHPAAAVVTHTAAAPPPATAPAMTVGAPTEHGGTASAGSNAAPIGDRKLRVLCLHGYLQNGEVFRQRIGSLRKALKSRAEFFFVDAPYLVEAADEQAMAESDGGPGTQGRSWWQWSDLEPGTRPSRAAHYSGWEASQAAILAALEQHAPIDGLLGFSQGATATSLFLAHTQPLLAQQQRWQLQSQPQLPQQAEGPLQADTEQQQQQQLDEQQQQLLAQLRFAVVIAGFLPRDASYAAALQRGRPMLPCLHVHGAADALVPEERSRALWECFDGAGMQVYQHPGAHMVPTCSGEFKQVLVQLLDSVRQGQDVEQHQEKKNQRQKQKKAGSGGGAEEAAAAAVAAVSLAVGTGTSSS